MRNKNRAAGTAPINNQSSKVYQVSFPCASKINILLGGTLLAMQSPSNDQQNKNQLLSIVEDILFLKAELGLYGGNNHG